MKDKVIYTSGTYFCPSCVREVYSLSTRLARAEKVVELLKAEGTLPQYFNCDDPLCDFEICVAVRAYEDGK